MGVLKKILYKLAGTNEDIEALYREKGVCNEWVDARLNTKSQKPFDKAINADMLISVERYAEAEEYLDSIKLNALSDDDAKGMTIFEKINLYSKTNRYETATELFVQNQKFLDIYFTSPVRERMATAYFDTVARVLAHNKDEQGAMHYLSLEKKVSEKYEADFMISYKLTNVAVLSLLGSESARQEYEILNEEILKHEFKMTWQKDYYLKLLEQTIL